MWKDDIDLVAEMVVKHGPVVEPYVECGGLAAPVIADYQRTIDAMNSIRPPDFICRTQADKDMAIRSQSEQVRAAQFARYIQIERPLDDAIPGYSLEDPATGGLPIERLAEKYHGANAIGTAVLLSVLEHVANPFLAIARLREAMQVGGLVIVSVPFMFPEHLGPEDCFRYTPTGLRHVFDAPGWAILEADWRLRIAADEGVRCIRSGRAQAIESCFLVARAVPA